MNWAGKGARTPGEFCSWLRSSTAPSESTPASINGASASTAPPAVRFTISSTTSSDTTPARTVVIAAAAGALAVVITSGAMSDKSGGAARPSSTRCHCTGIIATTDSARRATAVSSAAKPCATPIRPNPVAASIAAIRSLAAPRDAMPTSAHAPHCTHTEARPNARACVASASSHAFAAL